MPQPSLSDVHVVAALTDIATAYLMDDDKYIADKVFPAVPVQHASDKYFIYSKDDFFRDDAKPRADGTESAGSGYSLSTGSYTATVWAIHKDIGNQIRRNADPALDIDVATTKWVMQQLLIRRDRFFATTYMTTSVWGTDITGVASAPSASQTIVWSDDANGDPFTDIQTGETTILQNTGYEANILVLGWKVYAALKKHPLVIDRIKYTNPALSGTITPQLLAEAFDVEEILVSKGVYNTASEGITGSYSFINGANALLCHRAAAPGLMIPSAGYIFPWEGFTGLNNMGVKIMQIPTPLLGDSSVRVEGEMSFDMQVIGKDLGYFFSAIA